MNKNSNNHIKITKITLQIDNEELSLTTDQAKELYDQLKGLFEQNTFMITPYPNPHQNYQSDIPPWPKIWCEASENKYDKIPVCHVNFNQV